MTFPVKSDFIATLLMTVLLAGALTAHAQSAKLARANDAYAKLAYTPAIELYKQVLDEAEIFEAMWKLADCYRLTNQYDEAEYWFGKVVNSEEALPEHLLYYAQLLQVSEKYSEAAVWYQAYKERVPGDARADHQLQACLDPDQFHEEAGKYRIVNLPFNSPVYDFGPMVLDDGLIFSSSRDSLKGINRIHTWTGQAFFDLYYVEPVEQGQEGKEVIDPAGDQDAGDWTSPALLRGDVNTRYHEGPVAFMPGNAQVYFTRNNFDNTRIVGKTGKSTDKIVKLKLYSADVKGTVWENIQEFPYNNDEYSVGHAAISPDGEYLYFVSDMPGGYGGTDLYFSKRNDGSWSVPLNLGPSINTEGDEMFPYVHSDGEFYFSSDGHGGIGGLDIFRTQGSGTSWGEIRNIGVPINSSADDFGLVLKPAKDQGFFTSNREGGAGSDDIYKFIYEGIRLEGIVVDADTDEPICGAEVVMSHNDAEAGKATVKCDGRFEFSVVPEQDYRLKGCADLYECEELLTTTRGVEPGGTVFVKIPLKKPAPLRMEVQVVDRVTREPIAGSQVAVFDKCTETYIRKESNAAGMSYYEEVRVGCNYHISANAEGYMPGDADASVDGSVNPVTVLIELDRIGPAPIVLRHIYYDFDKSYIREEAELDLNKVLDFMNINPGTIVEIGSHTDARATFKYNEGLSERRARAAVDWLVQRGISRDRLVAVGYGELQLVNQCADNVPCSEEEHQRNRRTEFRVLDSTREIDVRSEERKDMDVDPCLNCPF